MRSFDNIFRCIKDEGEALYTLTSCLDAVFDTVDRSCLFGGVIMYCVMFYCGAGNGYWTLDTLGFSADDIPHSMEVFAIMRSLC